MDILAHALWAGAGVLLARRRYSISTPTAQATVALAVMPDLLHMIPVIAWSAFGTGSWSALVTYMGALPGQEPVMPWWVNEVSHNLHCFAHSGVVLGVLTLLIWLRTRRIWVPLLGWWSHVIIDVFSHSRDFYPSPVLWPFTREGFDGIAWNSTSFMVVNYSALTAIYLWLFWRRRREQRQNKA